MSKEFDNIYNEYMDYTPDKYSDVCREIKGEIDNERTADKSNESLFGPLPEKQSEFLLRRNSLFEAFLASQDLEED